MPLQAFAPAALRPAGRASGVWEAEVDSHIKFEDKARLYIDVDTL